MSDPSAIETRPRIAGLDDILDIERRPYRESVPFETTAALLEHAARAHGERCALRFLLTGQPGGAALAWSFQELWTNAQKAANLFRSLGVERDQPVALLAPHIPGAQFTLWGAQLAGCAFPINFLLNAEHVAGLLKAVDARVVVTLAPCAELAINQEVRRAAQMAGCVQHLLEIDPDEAAPAAGSFQQAMQRMPETLQFEPQLRAGSLAALYHTGGTTGLPKILRHSHGNEVHTSWFAAAYYDMRPGDMIVNGFPLFHVAGAFVYGLGCLAAGAGLLLPTLAGMRNQEFVRNLWQLADEHGVTHLGCVPTVLSALLNVPREGGSGATVRLALTGGSPLPNELAQRFSELHRIPVRNIFGMTECAGIVSIEPAAAPRRPGSVGLRLPYSEIAALPLEQAGAGHITAFCARGETGILALRGPHVSAGYLDASRNAGTFSADGWLISGDLGTVDEDGYLYLSGRAKDLIIRGGHNIDPGMLEEAFLRHPAVSACAAVGEPDDYAGELPVVFVVLKSGEPRPDAQALLAQALPAIGERAAVPKKVVVLDALPLTPIGKVYKPALRALAARAKLEELLQAQPLQSRPLVECSAESGGLLAAVRFEGAPAEADREAVRALAGRLGMEVRFG